MSVFILAASRTPVGVFGGALKTFSAADLAAMLLPGLLDGQGDPTPDGLVLGQAIQAGAGPDPAGRAARKAGLGPGTWAFTVNQGAGSGLQAIRLAEALLRNGPGGRVVAGGMESSSAAPYLLPSARWGTRMGAAPVLDALLLDGQAWSQTPLTGSEAAYARLSRERAVEAQAAGWLGGECAPLVLPGRRGPVRFDRDEALAPDRPGHGPDAPAAPGDGAALLLLASDGHLGPQPPLAHLRATAMGADSAEAIQRILQETGLSLDAIDRFELDDSRPGHALSLLARFPALAPGRVNLRGGALALGHPLAASGARMVGSLAHQLRDHDLHRGLAALEMPGCGMALLLERP